eukprot:3658008-Karenia_brevis.AAC.1
MEDDDPATIGPNGLNVENSRGQWLKQWATTQQLTIINTFYSKSPERRTTHIGTRGRGRQIDYFLISRQLLRHAGDAGSTDILDLGSDHKTVRLQLNLPLQQSNPKRKRRRNTNGTQD